MSLFPNEQKHPGACRFFKAGKWELYIFYIARGTKAEGAFGVLLEEGEVYGFPPKMATPDISIDIDTDLGMMRYYGIERQHPWEPRGWLFSDVSKIPRSDD